MHAAFVRATFSGEERHVRRLGKIGAIEATYSSGHVDLREERAYGALDT